MKKKKNKQVELDKSADSGTVRPGVSEKAELDKTHETDAVKTVTTDMDKTVDPGEVDKADPPADDSPADDEQDDSLPQVLDAKPYDRVDGDSHLWEFEFTTGEGKDERKFTVELYAPDDESEAFKRAAVLLSREYPKRSFTYNQKFAKSKLDED